MLEAHYRIICSTFIINFFFSKDFIFRDIERRYSVSLDTNYDLAWKKSNCVCFCLNSTKEFHENERDYVKQTSFLRFFRVISLNRQRNYNTFTFWRLCSFRLPWNVRIEPAIHYEENFKETQINLLNLAWMWLVFSIRIDSLGNPGVKWIQSQTHLTDSVELTRCGWC